MFVILKLLKYRFRAYYYLRTKNYNKALKAFEKFFAKDHLNPNRFRITDYDSLMTEIAEKIFCKKNIELKQVTFDFKKPNLLILNSEIYDCGGHTELALRFVNAFKDDFRISFLLSGLWNTSSETAPIKSEIIKQNVANFVEILAQMNYEDKIIEIYNYILESEFSTIFINIHMNDVVATAVLSLIKKYTNINIVFWNHSDHSFSLATSFSDTIITRTQSGTPLLKYLKNRKNVVDFLFLEKTNEMSVYSQEGINAEKEKLGIGRDSIVTLTGAPDYKIFADKKQPYLKLIKKLLDSNPQMVHIIMGASYDENKPMIDKIVGHDLIQNRRLIFLDSVPNFDFYIALSDLYIDSFPQGSALTLVDFIRNAKPVVVKVNEKNPIKSFQMYLSENYEFSCKTEDEMFDKITELLNDKDKYKKTSAEAREFYLERYAIKNVKVKYLELIK